MGDKILLINTLPRLDYWEIYKEPIIGIPHGLLCIGTLLADNGFEVIIIDPQVEKDFLRVVEKNLEGCLFAGISAMTAGIASGIQIAQLIKEHNPRTPIVWGGIHTTLFPEQTLLDPMVDIIAWGEGEETSLDLANALREETSLEKVKGIGFKRNGTTVFTERRDFINLEKMPLINYSLVDMEKYLYRDLESLAVGSGRAKVATIHSSRGCPYKCTFCMNTHPSQKYRAKSLERLIHEVEQVVRRYDPDIIYFQDDNFFANKIRAFKFFEEYERRGYRFRWFSLTRANYFNDEFLSNSFMARIYSSCLWLGLGVESGSERVRKLINKDISEEQVMAAAYTLGKYRVPTGYAFMVGLPSETEEEMLSTISLMLKIKEIHPEAQFAYQYYRPYPGSQLYDFAVHSGFVTPKSLREWASCQDVGIGYTPITHLPWINSYEFLKYLMILVSYVINDYPPETKQKFIFRWWIYRTFWTISYYFRKIFHFWKGCWLEVSLDDLSKKLVKSARSFLGWRKSSSTK